ncbi:MAG TPA: hypothetical protein VII22_06420 [Streptosporangiaceae bacterium]
MGEIHCERLSPTVQSLEALVVSGTRNDRRLDPKRWPDPGKPPSAELYAVVGGLIVWLLVDVLPHVHVSIGWHWREGENPAPELMLGDAPDVTTYREASASLQKAAVTGRDAHAVIKSLIAAGP